jgi:DNA-binding response OmpR family regulator
MNDNWNGAGLLSPEGGAPPAIGGLARSGRSSMPAGRHEARLRILLLTDDLVLAVPLRRELERAGHHVRIGYDEADAGSGQHDLVVADQRQLSGMRGAPSAAWLVFGDEPGALPRDEAVLADAVLARLASGTPSTRSHWTGGELVIDLAGGSIHLGGTAVELTPFEWQVIALLAGQEGRVVSRAEIARLIGGEAVASDNAVAVHLYNLRRKLGRHAIETIRGRGFRLRP